MAILTKLQQDMVTQNLNVVHWVIHDYIHVNSTILGLEYNDLFQEGCIWLCKAATTYNKSGNAKFSTYAKKVVRNGLLSYCKKTCNYDKRFTHLVIGENGQLSADGSLLQSQSESFDHKVSMMETLSLLDSYKQKYTGVSRLGIEALSLKIQGMRITDIAIYYQVPPSHIGAWISRSIEKLRKDSYFLLNLK